MIETLSLALVFALGLAIRFYANWRRAVRWAETLDAERAQNVRLTWLAEKERDANHAKWLDARRRYLDSLDEIAAMKAESDRGPEAAE